MDGRVGMCGDDIVHEVEELDAPPLGQELVDHGSVDDALAGRDPPHGVEELLHPADAFLHQVADAFRPLLDEPQRLSDARARQAVQARDDDPASFPRAYTRHEGIQTRALKLAAGLVEVDVLRAALDAA